MDLRCTYCQTMFSISRDDMLAGLEHMEENKQIYYDAHCPKCRRANRVERARMERFFPEWKKAIRTMAKEAEGAQAKPASKTEAVQVKPAARSQSGKTPSVKPATVKKVSAQKKKVASKPKAKPAGAGKK